MSDKVSISLADEEAEKIRNGALSEREMLNLVAAAMRRELPPEEYALLERTSRGAEPA